MHEQISEPIVAVDLRRQMAQHGGIYARELTRTFLELEQRVRDLSTVCRIVDALKHAQDVRRAFEDILDVLLDETNAEICTLMLFNREADAFIVTAGKSQTDAVNWYHDLSSHTECRHLPFEHVARRAVRYGNVISIPECAQVSGAKSAGLTGCLLCLPLTIDNETVGVVVLSHPKPDAFTDGDVRLMTLIKDQVAIAFNTIQITEDARRLAERAQRESEARLKGLVEHLPEGICQIDAAHRLRLANPSAREYLQALARDGSCGEALSRLGDKPLEEILKPRLDGLPHEIVLGEPPRRTFEILARPIPDGASGGGWSLVIRDVTRERDSQQRIKQQERLAAVGQLAAGIAHDFNNTLTTIIGFAELLDMRPDLPQSARRNLERIIAGGESAAQLVRHIMDFSRKTAVEYQKTDLLAFCRETIKLLERTLPESIRTAIAFDGEDYIVEADQTQLQQAITNLAVNARDAMPEGGELNITLSHRHVWPGQPPSSCGAPEGPIGAWVVLSVTDSGTGIPPHLLPRIYEPFFTTKQPGKGTGLGLAQVYGFAKQHSGHIDVKSEVGKGTVFTLYLPQAEKEALPQEAVEGDIPIGRGDTVLVVEDQEDVRVATSSMLESLNYRVLTAADGQKAQALYWLYQDDIALVLTDVVMPKMGGFDLLRALKGQGLDVQAVMMTGYPIGRTQEICPEGVAGWLEKPLRIDQLGRVLSEALKR